MHYVLFCVLFQWLCFMTKRDTKTITKCGYLRKIQNATFNYSCTCLETKVCIRKCCSEYQVFSTKNNIECVKLKSPELWEQNSVRALLTDVSDYDFKDLHLVEGFPCDHYFPYDEEDNFIVIRNGTLIAEAENTSEYCLEYVYELDRVVPFICIPAGVIDKQFIEQKEAAINCILLWVSMSFLLITFIVYAAVPRLRNLVGKCLLCYLLTAMSYTSLLIMVLKHSFQNRRIICQVVAYLTQYTALANFFWMNTIGFDLWLRMRKIQPYTGSNREREIKKFVLYSLYAWGSPLVVSGVTFLAEFPAIPFPKPNFGTPVCWFENEIAKRWYFSSIMTVLVIANVFMFINTVYIIFAADRKWKQHEKNGSQRHCQQQTKRFILYMKISLIMGLNWIAELLSQYFNALDGIWRVTDIANLLQGVFIFIVFVFKKNVLTELNKRLYPIRMFITAPGRNTVRTGILSTRISMVSNKGSTRKKSLNVLTVPTSPVA